MAANLLVERTEILFELNRRQIENRLSDSVDVLGASGVVDGIIAPFLVDVVFRVATGLLVMFVLVRCAVSWIIGISLALMPCYFPAFFLNIYNVFFIIIIY